jgi:hypothetical protein
MAYAIQFTPTGMSRTVYEEVHRKLAEAGYGDPAGRTVHVGFGDPEGLEVLDVWESMEQFQQFGEQLLPVLAELGVDAGEPRVTEVARLVIQG